MFYGIGAAVIAIIVRSAIKLVRTTVRSDLLLWMIFAALAITTAWTQSEIIWLFILCGFVAMLIKAPPSGSLTCSGKCIHNAGAVARRSTHVADFVLKAIHSSHHSRHIVLSFDRQ
jgi:chromate transport protein ChrA